MERKKPEKERFIMTCSERRPRLQNLHILNLYAVLSALQWSWLDVGIHMCWFLFSMFTCQNETKLGATGDQWLKLLPLSKVVTGLPPGLGLLWVENVCSFCAHVGCLRVLQFVIKNSEYILINGHFQAWQKGQTLYEGISRRQPAEKNSHYQRKLNGLFLDIPVRKLHFRLGN